MVYSASVSSVPFNQACIVYRYTSGGILEITHINAGFNCCPGKIMASVQIHDNVIVITEYEEEAACGCDCLFDVDMDIRNLAEGIYMLQIVEPYIGTRNEPFNFEITLSPGTQGTYCLDRTGYPWAE